jgi:RecA-family ATPase
MSGGERIIAHIEGLSRDNGAQGDEVGPEAPFAQSLADFVADKREAPEPLVGGTDDCIIPALGFALLIAKGGKGKTTFCIEFALHLAAGVAYLGLEIPRPLRVLFIENEGPREPFRRKLERKLEDWPHEIEGAMYVYDETWGHARLDVPDFVSRLNQFCTEKAIDLVIGDPLDSLGMEGEGTPSETRAMVDRFKQAGLFSERAWFVPHHSRKESVQDAVDEAAGAWSGRPDAMLALEKRKENQARLAFAKVRWQGRERGAYLLDFDPDTETFTFVKEEEGEERDYVVDVEAFLEGKPPKTSREIATAISASRDKVEEALSAHPDRFDSLTGEAAKAAGRRANAVLWELASGQKPVQPEGFFGGES